MIRRSTLLLSTVENSLVSQMAIGSPAAKATGATGVKSCTASMGFSMGLNLGQKKARVVEMTLLVTTCLSDVPMVKTCGEKSVEADGDLGLGWLSAAMAPKSVA